MYFLEKTDIAFRIDEGEGKCTPAPHEIWLAFVNDIGAEAFIEWINDESTQASFQNFYEENKYLYR